MFIRIRPALSIEKISIYGFFSAVPGLRQRNPNPSLPSTVTKLETSWGSKVYVVGTAHFSEESQDDVSKVTFIAK